MPAAADRTILVATDAEPRQRARLQTVGRRWRDAMFKDRQDAGRQLAERLASDSHGLGAGPPVVVGLARGGLAVAAEIADRLAAPLDVLIVRKIGVPWQPELGVGAIAEGGERVLNEALIVEVGLDAAAIDEVTAREQVELERRVRRYRGGRAPVPVAGRTVIVVDDGLATGYTAWAAILAVRARGASRVILAVPVAPPDSVAALGEVADDVVGLTQPAFFTAIGEFYRDFSPGEDEEVLAILGGPPAGRPIRHRRAQSPPAGPIRRRGAGALNPVSLPLGLSWPGGKVRARRNPHNPRGGFRGRFRTPWFPGRGIFWARGGPEKRSLPRRPKSLRTPADTL